MITVNEAKLLVFEHTLPLPSRMESIGHAAGLKLASHIYSPCDIPAFRQSSMDGYAIQFKDKNLELRITGEIPAGVSCATSISDGQCSRIFTGAPLPDYADTVIMQEKVTLTDNGIRVLDEALQKGSNVRGVGSEISKGTLAMEKNSLLIPAAIGFLAGIGIAEVEVIPKPSVTVLVTGKELRKPGSPLQFGQVYESNSYSLSAALKQEGIEHIKIVEVDDDLETLTELLAQAISLSDMVLLTGGVSVGDYDFVVDATKRCGVDEIFHKVKQKPGKPLYFGLHGVKPVFGLPGNPASVLSCYYNYVLPSLRKLAGRNEGMQQVNATLTQPCKKPAGLTHFLKGRYLEGKVTPLQAQESYKLSSFAQANCLITLEQDKQEFGVGETVSILILPH